jgi:hypothetical protein
VGSVDIQTLGSQVDGATAWSGDLGAVGVFSLFQGPTDQKVEGQSIDYFVVISLTS